MQSDPSGEHAGVDRLDAPAWLSEAGLSKLLLFTAAGLSFLLSVYLFFSGDRERGIFVGLWVPSILSAGTLLQIGGRHDR